MYKVIEGPDTGKTRKLLAECAKNNGLYVCKHPLNVKEKCLAYGIDIVNAIGYDEFASVHKTWKDVPIYIDELDKFVGTVFENVQGYNLTIND